MKTLVEVYTWRREGLLFVYLTVWNKVILTILEYTQRIPGSLKPNTVYTVRSDIDVPLARVL